MITTSPHVVYYNYFLTTFDSEYSYNYTFVTTREVVNYFINYFSTSICFPTETNITGHKACHTINPDSQSDS